MIQLRRLEYSVIGLPSVSDYVPQGCQKFCILEGIIRDVREIDPYEKLN